MKHNAVPTLSDVAAHAGVSLATASRALNGSTRVVRPELKALVMDAARELGYTVNRQAQAVAKGASDTIALVVGDIADPYFASVAAGVVRVARENQMAVTLTSIGPASSAGHEAVALEEAAIAAALRAQRPRAVIFAASRPSRASWESFEGLERLTVIGPEVIGMRRILVGNERGARDLATALQDIGYSDFIVLAGALDLSTVATRVKGFTSIAQTSRVIETEFTRDGAYLAMAEILAAGRAPQCVFAVTDIMAIGAMSAIRDAGLRPGPDVAIAGFDDIPLLRDVSPGLTTVSLPLEEIGARATVMALGDDADVTEQLDGSVLIRQSTPRLA